MNLGGKNNQTTNLKTTNKENCQKIKLYGKELKKHSSRLVGEVEMVSQGREDVQQGSRSQAGQARRQLVD